MAQPASESVVPAPAVQPGGKWFGILSVLLGVVMLMTAGLLGLFWQLEQRLGAQSADTTSLVETMGRLSRENQSLRGEIQILKYLIATRTTPLVPQAVPSVQQAPVAQSIGIERTRSYNYRASPLLSKDVIIRSR